MWSTRVRRTLAWTLWVSLIVVPALSTTLVADQSDALSQQLAATSLTADVRRQLTDAGRARHPHDERFTSDGVTVDVHFWLDAGSIDRTARIVDATMQALRIFTTWYGAFPSAELVVIEGDWRTALAGASYPGAIVIRPHWFSPVRDKALERTIVGAIARQFVFAVATTDTDARWFDEAWALYSGTRAIHEALENNNAATVRLFGGHIPAVIRPVQWSSNRVDPRPRVRHFDEIDQPSEAPWRTSSAALGSQAQRAALALHTLERYIGWPAMQQALAGYRERAMTSGGSPATFAQVVSEQRGRDISWFFNEAFKAGATFDYAVDELVTEAAGDGSGEFRTRVSVRRLGNATFAGSSDAPVGSFSNGRALAVSVSFADGSVADDFWDGRAPQKDFEYMSKSPAVSASVDPRAVLLLDVDRSNNTLVLERRFRPIGARLALHWMVWLQDLMLSYSALA